MIGDKIFITGAAGVGKTTLGKRISKILNIPFITTSAKHDIWPKFGFKDYNDAHTNCSVDPDKGLAYQLAIFNDRKTLLSGDTWVTDRSPIDNLAYFMFQLSHHDLDDDIVDSFIHAIQMEILQATHIVYLKHSPEVILENDGFRVLNKLHQGVVDALIQKSLELVACNKGVKVITLNAFNNIEIDYFLSSLTNVTLWDL